MTLEQLKSLNEDEMAMLWYIANKMERPVITGVEFPIELFTSIDNANLNLRVINAKPQVKEEAMAVYDSLKVKMGIE